MASENTIIQYPTSVSEMSVAAGASITPHIGAVNKYLRKVVISIPQNGFMVLHNNNQKLFFFSDESGTLSLDAGVFIGDMRIELSNAGSSAARFSYYLVFTDDNEDL